MAKTTVSRMIRAPIERVWDVFTDIPASAERLSGLQRVEVLTPQEFGHGFRWRETRRMWGQEATEEMWVTRLDEQRFYEVAAASHGAQYLSRFDFVEVPEGVRVDMVFSAEPESTVAKAAALLTGWLASGSVRKMLQKDLDDLAAVCEG